MYGRHAWLDSSCVRSVCVLLLGYIETIKYCLYLVGDQLRNFRRNRTLPYHPTNQTMYRNHFFWINRIVYFREERLSRRGIFGDIGDIIYEDCHDLSCVSTCESRTYCRDIFFGDILEWCRHGSFVDVIDRYPKVFLRTRIFL